MKPEPDRLTGEELLEAALRGEFVEGADREEQELLRSFILACREAAPVEEGATELCERALSASTREDLSWRGDLRIVSRYVRDGIRSSPMLRLAAASLVVHLIAIPVVALFMLAEKPVLPEFRIEMGRDALPFEDSWVRESAGEQVLEIGEPGDLDALLVDNTLRWSRWQLSRLPYPLEADLDLAPRWLRTRVAILWPGRLSAASGAESLKPLSGSYRHVIELERRLDRYLVEPRIGGFSAEERSVLDRVALMVRDEADAGSWLAVATLARAESYGWRSEKSGAALSRAREVFPGEHPWRPLIEIEGDVRGRLPLDPLWIEALRVVDPNSISAEWLEWIRSLTPPSPR
jgi:hypothetical protein